MATRAIKFPLIGFGGIPISRLEYATGVKVVQACIDMGVTFMDTAVAYKDSEIKIGEGILGHDIIVATKKYFCRRCGYCMPCPQEIQIIRVMNARASIKRLGAKSFFDEKVKEFVERMKTCTKCGQCESRCPYNLHIRSTIEKNAQYLEGIASNIRLSE